MELQVSGELDLAGDIKSSGSVIATVDSLFLRSPSLVKSNGDVTLSVSGRYEQWGDVMYNGAVSISTGEYRLHCGHDLRSNTSCTLSGAKDPASVDALGCVEVP